MSAGVLANVFGPDGLIIIAVAVIVLLDFVLIQIAFALDTICVTISIFQRR